MIRSFEQWKSSIFQSIVATIQAWFPDYLPILGDFNVETGFSSAHGKELHDFGIQNEYVRKQNNPLTADSIREREYGQLEQWGFIKLRRYPYSQGKGEYLIELTGDGGIYEAGTKFTAQRNSFTYTLKETVNIGNVDENGFTTTSEKTLSMGTNTTLFGANVRLSMPVPDQKYYGVIVADKGGIPAALKINDELNSTIVLQGIDDPVRVVEVLVDPTNEESIEEYKEDTLQAYRIARRGGARGDIVLWCDNISGVRRVYPYAGDNEDTLGALWIVIESTENNGDASEELLDIVKRELDQLYPLSDPGVILESIIPVFLSITVNDIINIEETDRDEFERECYTSLGNYLKSVKFFIDGVDRSSSKNDTLQKIVVTSIVNDIAKTFNGYINEAYWNPSERTKEIGQNETFRLASIIFNYVSD